MADPALHRVVWRWHFYAGLFVLPFILILSLTGSVYLFKPQIERWEERAVQASPAAAPVPPHEQVEAAMAAHLGGSFLDYRLPRGAGDAAMVRLSLSGGVRDVFVAPGGEVLGTLDADMRVMAITKRIHSELLLGRFGNLLVELAASWAIVMVLTGLYLWWPRGRGMVGTVWPRLNRGKQAFLRDLHVVTGFWVSSLALLLLVTGLPWAGVWGNAFGAVRAQMGWVDGPAQWAVGGTRSVDPAGAHDHSKHRAGVNASEATYAPAVLDRMVAKARAEGLAFPAIVTPPGAPGRFDAPGVMAWTIRSDVQNPPLRTTIRYDLAGEREMSRERFEDGHVIDRVVGYGIAWHEGQLFGWINQMVGLLTAAGLITLAVTGFVMWRRRKPEGVIGAPMPEAASSRTRGIVAILLTLALLLPMLALSLVVLWLFERVALPRIPGLANWLGVAPAARS